MGAAILKHDFTANVTLKEAITSYFNHHTVNSTEVLFWKFFQCWVTRDCKLKADLTDEEVALFFDQLIALVAAANMVHQANRASLEPQKGEGHE